MPTPKPIQASSRCVKVRLLLGWGLGVCAWVGFPATGVGKRPSPVDPVVALPEVRVEAWLEDAPWQYARADDVEILTACPPELSRDIWTAYRRGVDLFPGIILGDRTSPATLVLFDQKQQTATVPERLRFEMVDEAHWGDEIFGSKGTSLARDRDSSVTVANLHGVRGVGSVNTAQAWALIMEQAPAAPDWLIAGLFSKFGLFRMVIRYSHTSTIRLARLAWPGESEPGIFPEAAGKFPPFDVMFGPTFDSKDSSASARQQSEFHAGLFARWSLFGPAKNGRDRRAFWVFAEESRHGRGTEALFREYYGMDYAAACAEMQAYLRSAHTGFLELQLKRLDLAPPDIAAMKFRSATPGETARLLGNYLRLQAADLRSANPELSGRFERAARRMLQRGLPLSNHDPALRGVLGLLEADTGHPVEARPHLEAAFAAKAAGSRALLALAGLRLAEEEGNLPAGAKLPAEAVDRVFPPLLAARDRKPAIAEVYTLFAEIAQRGEAVPTRESLAILLEGTRFFPRDTTLLLATAESLRHAGYDADAADVARQGEAAATDSESRASFIQLLSANTRETPTAKP